MAHTQAQTQAIDSLERQIAALEVQRKRWAEGLSPKTNIFALNNLIKKKQKELDDLKNFEWLAK